MKRGLKSLPWILLLLALLGWLGGYLSWHFRITGALESMEVQAMPAPAGSLLGYSVPEETTQQLKSAGCRALPYLFRRLNPRKNPMFLAAASTLIYETVERCGSATDLKTFEYSPPLEIDRISAGDSAVDRA